MDNMKYDSINLADKFNDFSDLWSPKIIAQLNEYQLKVVKMLGEFVWRNHPETDEVFIVLEGHLDIEFPNGEVSLNKGEMFVVPKGMEHKPVAEKECHILLIEPAGTVNTGDEQNNLTAPYDVWI